MGETLAEVHARTDDAAVHAADEVLAAYAIGEEPPQARDVLLEVVT